MFRNFTSLFLIALLISLGATIPAFAGSSAEKEAQLAAKIKAGIRALGTGKDACVKITLKDQTKLEGYISEAGDESFIITTPKPGTATPVAYPQVGRVKGHNLSTRAKVAIGVGIAIVIAVAVIAIIVANSEIEFPNR
ncbi:MAG TPA: hypothetical protein VFD58_34850 [Blastocatellia bacterium]|nr:hypothetical protein [Blastocatellia bacterium]